VQPIPGTGAIYQISRNGGRQPRWSLDGRELYFYDGAAGGAAFTAVTITTQPSFAAGSRVDIPRPFSFRGDARNYDVTGDGRIIAVPTANELAVIEASQIQIVLNWFQVLKQRAPWPESN
jgi:hypothetical protein